MAARWHSDQDMPMRKDMIRHLMRLLKKDYAGQEEDPGDPRQRNVHVIPCDDEDTPQLETNSEEHRLIRKIPQIAKQLEVDLYRSAPTLAAYTDLSSLKARLKAIAIRYSRAGVAR